MFSLTKLHVLLYRTPFANALNRRRLADHHYSTNTRKAKAQRQKMIQANEPSIVRKIWEVGCT